MADYNAFTPSDVTIPFGDQRYPPVDAARQDAGATTVTLYYRTAAGARGSTTDASAIPVGAVVERRVTS